jgi:ATP-dependent Clp protease ATP-binding subunit ClpA
MNDKTPTEGGAIPDERDAAHFLGRATPALERALEIAAESAMDDGSAWIKPDDLFVGIIGRHLDGASDEVVPTLAHKLLSGLGGNPDRFRAFIVADLKQVALDPARGDDVGSSGRRPVLSRASESALSLARHMAREEGADAADTPHLLIALLDPQISHCDLPATKCPLRTNHCFAAEKLRSEGAAITMDIVRSAWDEYRKVEAGGVAHPSQAGSIDDLTIDLTLAARLGQLDPVVGREREIDRLISILSRRTKNNPLLIGEAGVGKTAIAEGLAQRIADGRVPKRMRDKRVLSLVPAQIVAGTAYRGQFETKALALIRELRDNPDNILFIDELHTIVGAGSGNVNEAGDFANLLKPALARGQIHCIGATTEDEFVRFIESDAALARRFRPVRVAEPSAERTREILETLAGRYGSHHEVTYEPDALDAAVELSARYMPAGHFPDKAIDAMDEAGAEARNDDRSVVTKSDVGRAVAGQVGRSAQDISSPLAERLDGLGQRLAAKVSGQEEAAERVAAIVSSRRMHLRERRGPLATILLVGPPGAGKRRLVGALAEDMFDGLTTIDLAGYAEPHAVSGLRGSPAGYVGFDLPAPLVEPFRRTPARVLLLRSPQLAHQAARDIIAELIVSGEMSDTRGRRAVHRDAVVILTMDIAESSSGAIGFAGSGSAAKAEAERFIARARKDLGGPFCDLLDDIIVMMTPTPSATAALFERELAAISERIAKQHASELVVDASVAPFLGRHVGTGGTVRRRPAQVFEEYVEAPIARAIIARHGRFGRLHLRVEGDLVVVAGADEAA